MAPINIELGRYSGLPLQQRTCLHCQDSVEDEIHVILQCPLYTDIRISMFDQINEIFYDMHDLNEIDVLGLVLSNGKLVKISIAARSCTAILEKRRSFML